MDYETCKRVILCDKSKFNVFQSDGRQIVRLKRNTSLEKSNLQLTVKYGAGQVMVWGRLSAAGVESLHIIDKITDKYKYINIFK